MAKTNKIALGFGFIVVLLIIIGTLYGTGVLSITDLGIGNDGYVFLGDSSLVVTNQECDIKRNIVCPNNEGCYMNEANVKCETDYLISDFSQTTFLSKSWADKFYGVDTAMGSTELTDDIILDITRLSFFGNSRSPEFYTDDQCINADYCNIANGNFKIKENIADKNFKMYYDFEKVNEFRDGIKSTVNNFYLSKDLVFDSSDLLIYSVNGLVGERIKINLDGLLEIKPSTITENKYFISVKGKLISQPIINSDELYLIITTEAPKGVSETYIFEDARTQPVLSCTYFEGEGLTHHTYTAGEEIFINDDFELSGTNLKFKKFCYDHGAIKQVLDQRGSTSSVELYNKLIGKEGITKDDLTFVVPENQEYTVFFIAETNRVCQIGESLNIETNVCEDTFFLANKLTVELEALESQIAEGQLLQQQFQAEIDAQAERLKLAELNVEEQKLALNQAQLTIEQNTALILEFQETTEQQLETMQELSNNQAQFEEYIARAIILLGDNEDKLQELLSLIDENDIDLINIINNAIEINKENQDLSKDLEISSRELNDILSKYEAGLISLEETLMILDVSNVQLGMLFDEYEEGLNTYTELLLKLNLNDKEISDLLNEIDISDQYAKQLQEQIRQDKIKNTILISGIVIFLIVIAGLIFYIFRGRK